MQEFLNPSLKPYNALTREEKHIILDALIDGICEVFVDCIAGWETKESISIGFTSIYRTKPKEYKKLAVPWQHINDKWNYIAMDGDGKMFLFEDKPNFEKGSNRGLWTISSAKGKYANLYNILKLDTTGIVAEHSLTQRPTGSDTQRPEGV